MENQGQKHSFFALINRMKHIARWSLMRTNVREDLMQHSASVAIFGQALAIIKNEIFGGDVDVDKVASLALYHDTAEVLSGDMPTPVKYYNESMKNAYAEIEDVINVKLIGSLPDELKLTYAQYLQPNVESAEYKLMKVADKLSAYVKSLEERHSGNHDFDKAFVTLGESIEKLKKEYPELKYFMDNFLDEFTEPIDTLL
ncbi:MAG: 5'-deoxynucleotidase [Clostridia bacterium]|nr:5'-deoxynucleotidase [Clostridia bacterium]